MPKIREYGVQNLEFQNPGLSSSAALEHSGDMGRAVDKFGQTVENVGDMVYRRQAQEETSNLNASFAQLNAQVTSDIDDGTQDGSIDAQKYTDGLQKKIDSMDQNITTREGRNAFERNAGHLQEYAFKRASRGQAAVAGAVSVNNVKTTLSGYSQSLMADPSGFAQNREAMLSAIDDQVQTGGLKATEAEKLKVVARNNLAEATMRGWARLDPDLAEKKLYSDEFKGDLDSNSMSQMQDYINKVRVAKGAEESRSEAAQKRAEKATGDAWMAQNLHSIADGSLDANKILDAPGLKPQFKLDLLKKVQAHANDGGGITNPAVLTQIHSRILADPSDPQKIVDPSQIIDKVGNGISWKDFEKLTHDMPKTPDGEDFRQSKKSALDVAKAEVLKQGFSAFGGSKYSADSQRQLQMYIDDVRRAERQAVKDKKPLSSLYDPKSPDYVASPERLKKYQMTPKEYFDSQAQERLKSQPAFNSNDEGKIKPGESIVDWKKRTGN